MRDFREASAAALPDAARSRPAIGPTTESATELPLTAGFISPVAGDCDE
jgi:hypothetical protein